MQKNDAGSWLLSKPLRSTHCTSVSDANFCPWHFLHQPKKMIIIHWGSSWKMKHQCY